MRFFSIDNIITTGLILLILKSFAWIFQIDFLNQLNNQIQDFKITDIVFSKMRNQDLIKPDSNIVLVNLGDLERDEIAEQIKIINRYKPKVIGVDVIFRVEKGADKDIPLAEAFSHVDNLVLVSKLLINEDDDAFTGISNPIPVFDKYGKKGFANFIEDEFMTIREFSPVEYINKSVVKAFAVQIAEIYNPIAAKKLFLRNNETEIINYERNIDKYKVLDWDYVFTNKDNLDFLNGKIVLLGYLGSDLKSLNIEDNWYSPMNPNYIGKAYPDMYGIVIHANIISMILNCDYIDSMPDWIIIILLVLFIYLNMALFSFMFHKYPKAYESISILVILFEAVLLFGSTFVAFKYFNYSVDLKRLFYALLLYEMVFETYHGSLKPLFTKGYNKVLIKIKQK